MKPSVSQLEEINRTPFTLLTESCGNYSLFNHTKVMHIQRLQMDYAKTSTTATPFIDTATVVSRSIAGRPVEQNKSEKLFFMGIPSLHDVRQRRVTASGGVLAGVIVKKLYCPQEITFEATTTTDGRYVGINFFRNFRDVLGQCKPANGTIEGMTPCFSRELRETLLSGSESSLVRLQFNRTPWRCYISR